MFWVFAVEGGGGSLEFLLRDEVAFDDGVAVVPVVDRGVVKKIIGVQGTQFVGVIGVLAVAQVIEEGHAGEEPSGLDEVGDVGPVVGDALGADDLHAVFAAPVAADDVAEDFFRSAHRHLPPHAFVADADTEGERFGEDVGEAGGFHAVLHGLSGDEGVDAFGEVFVGTGFVAADEGGGDGHDFTEVEVVEGPHKWVCGEGEFEDDQAATGLEDAREFVNGVAPVGDVADAEGDGEDVGGVVGEGEGEGVALCKCWIFDF